jgi:hypothetical protein
MEIENHPNYLIYDDGRVFSKKRNKFLKQNKSGYYYSVALDCKTYQIHRLLALHYIPNPENLPCVDHKDRNKSNNNLNNLRWVTISENGLNRNHQENNKLKIKNIFFCNTHKKYIFKKQIKDKNVSKTFKTLEEAVKYRDCFYDNNKEILSM